MKFRIFGKALLITALCVGAVLSITSCVQSYTVGFLYVTGTETSGKPGQGIISGFKIDHNTGFLHTINGMPIASGGSNPGRAVLVQGSRFLYVLNRGADANGGLNCTPAAPCAGANVTQFAVGGNGILSPQPEQSFTQGNNPFRLLADTQGNYVYVLDHDAPDSGNGAASNSCTLALGAGVTTCGDITVFKVDTATGRLSLVINSQVTAASGQPLAYFPVPANPIDFVINGGYILTLSGTPGTGDSVFPYTVAPLTGQLTISQNGSQPLNILEGTALQVANGFVYVLDNEPLTIPPGSTTSLFPPGTYPSQILPYSIGTGGSLQAQTGGAVPADVTQSNPLFLVGESKGNWVYLADTGDNQSQSNAQSGITGYVIDKPTRQLEPMSGSPFPSGAGPQCLVEDPSNQFLYTANYNSSNVTGLVLDQNSGVLSQLPGKADKTYSLNGPAAYCLVNGRTS
jgi:DNA-binding beta-propeller fold protein YncE